MTKHQLLPTLLAAAVVLCGGCSMLKKSSAPKENPSLAGETEENLKRRWIEKRTAELVAQGVAAEAARAQAIEEFRAKFAFTSAAQK